MTQADYQHVIRDLVRLERIASQAGHHSPLRRQIADAVQTATESYAEYLRDSRTFAPESP